MDANTIQKVHNAYIYTEENELDRLWREDAPKTLIKFFPAKYEADGTNYFLKHINERTMWLASPSTFNDPFDCVVNINYESEAYRIVNLVLHSLVGGLETRKIINSDLGETALKESSVSLEQEMSKVHNEMERKIYVTCFSEPDNLFSVRMWGIMLKIILAYVQNMIFMMLITFVHLVVYWLCILMYIVIKIIL